jgi:hypothetical protein
MQLISTPALTDRHQFLTYCLMHSLHLAHKVESYVQESLLESLGLPKSLSLEAYFAYLK